MVLADNECDRYQSSYDRTYCMSKISAESDKELNNVYQQLRKVLSKTTKQELVLVQRKWIKYRNDMCEDNGTINVDCNYRETKARTEYLRDRLRECKAGTCRTNEVLSESW